MLVKHLPSDEEVSLEEVENEVGAWVALAMIHGPCMEGDGFSTYKDDTLLTDTC